MILGEKFYEALGHLYYAVIKADKEFDKEEFASAIKYIRDYWLPLEEKLDSKGESIALIAVDTIHNLKEKYVPAKDALKVFKEYYLENQKHFSSHLRHHIRKTCEKLAEMSHGVDKHEAKILKEVKELVEE